MSDNAAANVCGRLEGVVGSCGGFAASSENGDTLEVENGFELAAFEPEEEVEKGFEEEELDAGFTPNKLSPRAVEVIGLLCDVAVSILDSEFPLSFRLSLPEVSEILIPLIALMLPSFRLQVFRRHVST